MSSQFTIVNPCPKKWDDLTGTGRQRYCDDCGKSVHALANYSPSEWHRIWAESSGHACAVISCQSLAPKRSRRAILVGAFFTALPSLLAQSGRVRIRVTDPTGAAVPEAAISLLDQKRNVARTIKADHAGEAVFAGLPGGTSMFSVALFGFLTQRLIVTVPDGGEVTAQTALQVGETLMGEVIEVKPKRHWWSAK